MRIALLLIWIPALVLVTTSCQRKKQSTQAEQTVATVAEETTTPAAEPFVKTEFLRYSRTPCFGRCPYFNLLVYSNGQAIYEGKNFVDLIGIYHSQFDEAALQLIMETAEAIHFFELKEKYDDPHVTDLPTTIISLSRKKDVHTVEARYKAPKELNQLYEVLDTLIKQAGWTPARHLTKD